MDKDNHMFWTAYNICHKMSRESLCNFKLIISLKFTWNSPLDSSALSNLNGGFGGAPPLQMFYNSACCGRNQVYIEECEFRALEVTFTQTLKYVDSSSLSQLQQRGSGFCAITGCAIT